MRLISAGSLVRAQSGPVSLASQVECEDRRAAACLPLPYDTRELRLGKPALFGSAIVYRELPTLKTGNKQKALGRLREKVRAPKTPAGMRGFERALVAMPGDQ